MSWKLLSGLSITTAVLLTSQLYALAVYSHTSPAFGTGVLSYEAPGSGLSPSTTISASITYSSVLPPNLKDNTVLQAGGAINSLADIPSNWLFSDGVRQWTPSNSHFYIAVVDTDASGNITGWDLNLYSNPGFSDPQVYIISSTPSTYGSAEVNLAYTSPYATAYVFYGPGVDVTWAPPVVTPSSPFTTYTYHGNAYNTCSGTYCTGGPYALSAEFTTTLTASALANLPYTDITSSIVSFTFTDGSGLTIDNSNASYKDFNISTGASGNIATWLITSCGSSCNIQMQTNWDSPFGFIPGADFSETTASFAGSYGFISNDPGRWSASPVAAFSATQIAIMASGLLYSRVTRTYNGTVTITNISGGALGGPFPIVLTSLTPGVTLTNTSGTVQGGPYINPGVSSLAPGQSITVHVQFSNPSNALISFTPVVY